MAQDLVGQIERLLDAARRAHSEEVDASVLRSQVERLKGDVAALQNELAATQAELTEARTKAGLFLSAVPSPELLARIAKDKGEKEEKNTRRPRIRSSSDDSGAGRMRSSSDDGTFFSSYNKLTRICSFTVNPDDLLEGSSTNPPEVPSPNPKEEEEEPGDQQSSLRRANSASSSSSSKHTSLTMPHIAKPAIIRTADAEDSDRKPGPELESTTSRRSLTRTHSEIHSPFEDGINQLRDLEIEPNTRQDHRCGYRLLTCNDMSCVTQRIDTGLIHIPHLTKMLVKAKWIAKPRTVLVVKKPFEPECCRVMTVVVRHLTETFGVRCIVEEAAMDTHKALKEELPFLEELVSLGVVPVRSSSLHEYPIDFNVCIGGDGTIIWLSHLFAQGCSPVLSVSMGSLGFLSTVSCDSVKESLDSLMKQDFVLTLRSRLEAHVKRADGTRIVETVLNEVVVDRGPNSSIVFLELYIGSGMTAPITHVQGDGIIVSTPTGSTAYSLSAGGSIVHPSIPCVVITPICPHSLSFRPIVVSDTTSVRLRVPETARTSAYVSFDGSKQIELRRGDEVRIRVSEHPVPCICNRGESEDWFSAIKASFQWNERIAQKQMHSSASSL